MEAVQLPGILDFAALGVGGILAGVMFYFYRTDRKEAEQRWQGQSEILLTVVKENTEAITALRMQLGTHIEVHQ